MEQSFKVSWLLFRIAFSISAFTFGGGYIAIPMMEKYFVDKLGLITKEELLDMAAIAQSNPGAIAVNIAVLVGYRLSKLKGAIISCIGTILPPIIILSFITYFYQTFSEQQTIRAVLKGMEAGVAAIIVSLIVDMTQAIVKEKDYLLIVLIPLTFICSFVFSWNAFLIILGAIVICILKVLLIKQKEMKV